MSLPGLISKAADEMLTTTIRDETVSCHSAQEFTLTLEDGCTFKYIQHLSLQRKHILFEDLLQAVQSKATFSLATHVSIGKCHPRSF